MPHARAKIVDRDGNIVPIGTRGELCMSGYQLQAGYWNNSEKTNECMVRDDSGVLWLHTGDEAVFDDRGYCSITGRFKDIIIRGTSRWCSSLPSPRTNRKQEGRTYTRWKSRNVWLLIRRSAWRW
jgi:acyl-CoA synthetase (AMP-forming)/AMP-acid ligase II